MRAVLTVGGLRGAVKDFLRSAESITPAFWGRPRKVLSLEVLVRRLPFPHPSKAVSPGPSLPSPLLPDSFSTAGSISMVRTVVHSGVLSFWRFQMDKKRGMAQMTKMRIIRNTLWKESRKVGVLRNPSVKNLTLQCTNAKCTFLDGVA